MHLNMGGGAVTNGNRWKLAGEGKAAVTLILLLLLHNIIIIIIT